MLRTDHFCYVSHQFLTIFDSKLRQVIVSLQLGCWTFGDTQSDGRHLSVNDVQLAGFQEENIPDGRIEEEKRRKEIFKKKVELKLKH